MNRFNLRAAVFLLLVQDDKVLLIRRSNTGWCDGRYDLPAGHIDGGEYLSEAMVREAHEEIGISFKREDAEFVFVAHFKDPKEEYINVAFRVKTWTGEPRNMEPHKHDDLQWFDLDALPELLTPGTRAILEGYKSGTQYAEITLP